MLRKRQEAPGLPPQSLRKSGAKNWHNVDSKSQARPQRLSPWLEAWCRILHAVAEQREALDFRIRRAEPHDAHLAADVQAWCELSRALADFFEATSAA